MPLIIGITGRKYSGKDTFCQHLIEALGQGVKAERLAFADPLKAMLAKTAGIPVSQINEDKARWRVTLQQWGTEIMRHYHGHDYWINRMRQKIECSPCDVVVLTDVRFKNEADMVRDMGGILVRMVRKESLWRRLVDWLKPAHRSEREMDQYEVDYTVTARPGDRDVIRLSAATMAYRTELRSLPKAA
jgi:hypothetical protein